MKTSVVFFTVLLSAGSLPAQTRRNYTVDLVIPFGKLKSGPRRGTPPEGD